MPRGGYQYLYGGGMYPFGGAALTGLYQGGGWGSPRYGSGNSGGGGGFNRGFWNSFALKVAEDNDLVDSLVEAEAEDASMDSAVTETVDHVGTMEVRTTGTGLRTISMPE
ncbi:hypothetical protein LTR56_004223 [Elasticomyces elasticus]|nr:hypothetical protein LTR56_004223 [Elasticomyces elasticus]KAK3655112.1 hypothetical protein LTR22_010422 [Elasticomyces elasticus]KAK4907697.1 hypothetical protein LTR49_023293 [Elasticomyces elasticus]KAK5750561.1 hypothetical protein LTS12_019351 [Elasticomyces elasticus]